jgi:hypothetical protein
LDPELQRLLTELVDSLRNDRRNLEAIAENTRVDRGQTVAINKLLNVFSSPGVAGPGGATAAFASQLGQYQKNFNDIQKSAISMGRDFKSINSTQMIQSLEDSYGATISMQAALEAFNAGIGLQSKNALTLAAEMKATGQNSAAMLATLREGQVVGNLTNSQIDALSLNLQTTSKQYGISSDNLVKSLNVLSNRMQDFGAIGLADEMNKVMIDMTAKYGAGSEQLVGQFIDKITRGDNLANLQKLGIAQDVAAFGMNATADQLEVIAQKAAGSMQTLVSQMESGIISRFQALRMAENLYGEEGKLALLVAQLDRQEATALGATDATEQLHVQADRLYDSFYALAPVVNALAPTVQALTLAYSVGKSAYDAATGSINMVGNAMEGLVNFLSNEAPISVRFFETEIGQALDNIGNQAAALRLSTSVDTGPEFRRRYTMGYLGQQGGFSPYTPEYQQMLETQRGVRRQIPRRAYARGGTTTTPANIQIGEAGPEALITGTGLASILTQPNIVDLSKTADKLNKSANWLHTAFGQSSSMKSPSAPATRVEVVASPKTSTLANPMIAPPIANPDAMGSMKMMGGAMALGSVTTVLSQVTDGNNKIVQYLSMATTALTTLVTLQQAASMLGGLAGMKGMLAGLLPALLPALAGLAPFLLPVLAVGAGAAAISALASRERKKTIEDAKVKPAQISTNEYFRVSQSVAKDLFADVAKPTVDTTGKALAAIAMNTEKAANLAAGQLRETRNKGVTNMVVTGGMA